MPEGQIEVTLEMCRLHAEAASERQHHVMNVFGAGCLLRQHDDPVNPLIKDSEWGALEECSRAQLMWALQQRLPPSVMIPDSRLEALVEQALESQVRLCPMTLILGPQYFALDRSYLQEHRWLGIIVTALRGSLVSFSSDVSNVDLSMLQVARCPYHNTQHFRISLFSNYQAGIEQLPTQPHQVCLLRSLTHSPSNSPAAPVPTG